VLRVLSQVGYTFNILYIAASKPAIYKVTAKPLMIYVCAKHFLAKSAFLVDLDLGENAALRMHFRVL